MGDNQTILIPYFNISFAKKFLQKNPPDEKIKSTSTLLINKFNPTIFVRMTIGIS